MLLSTLDPQRPFGERLAISAGCILISWLCFQDGRRIVRERYMAERTRHEWFWRLFGLDLPLEGRRAVWHGWLLQLGSVLFIVAGVIYAFFPNWLAN